VLSLANTRRFLPLISLVAERVRCTHSTVVAHSVRISGPLQALPLDKSGRFCCRPSRGRPGKRKGGPRTALPCTSPLQTGVGAAAYLVILETTPAPTVRPPSRIAKRRPSSIATGLIRVTAIFTLSPGIT